MYTNFKKHLETELQGIRDAGLYKNERIITTPQSADIAVEGRKRTYAVTAKGIEAYRTELERLRQCIMDAEAPEEG